MEAEPNIPDIADRINGIVSNAHYQVDRSEENMNRYRSRVIEMIENTAKSYHQSKLQALKQRLDDYKAHPIVKRRNGEEFKLYGFISIEEAKRIITNLEDNE